MTNSQIAKKCEFNIANEASENEVTSVFACDLLSWAMGRCNEGAAWCTVMGNVNTIAVAALADAACIVLCHDAVLMDDALQKAKEVGINVYLTSLPVFEAGLAIHGNL